MCVCLHIYMCITVYGNQKKALGPMEPELQRFVSCLISTEMVLGLLEE